MDNLEKAMRTLVLIHLREMDSTDQTRILAAAGYTANEISQLTGVKAASAAKLMQRDRKGTKKDA